MRPAICDRRMPYQILCNGVKREGVKVSPDLACGLFSYLPFHKIRYGIYRSSEVSTGSCYYTEREGTSTRYKRRGESSYEGGELERREVPGTKRGGGEKEALER